MHLNEKLRPPSFRKKKWSGTDVQFCFAGLRSLGSHAKHKAFNRRSRLGIRIPAGGTPYDGLFGKAPPERGTFLRLQVYERVRIFLVVVELKGKGHLSFGSLKGLKRANR